MKTASKLQALKELPPWDWPRNAGRILLDLLKDPNAPERETAAALAGENVVLDDRLAEALLAVLENPEEPEGLRGTAAISLGPALELCDDWADDDDPHGEPPLSGQVFSKAKATLRRVYEDEAAPKLVRRRALEAAVRTPEDWHRSAISTAYRSGDAEWKLTAVFCMEYVKGFEREILELIESEDDDVRYHAVCAAGNWELKSAWAQVRELALNEGADQDVRLAAIEAVASIDSRKAREVLGPLAEDRDGDIAEAALEALAADEDDFF